jgi:hypothetical protein
MINISVQNGWRKSGATLELHWRQGEGRAVKKEAAGGSSGMLSVQSDRRSVMLYFF